MKSKAFASCLLLVAISAIAVTLSNHESAHAQGDKTQKPSPSDASLDFIDVASREMKIAGEIRGSASSTQIRRAKVPGGWLVTARPNSISSSERSKGGVGITFVPDPKHEWNGASLP